MGEKNTQPLPPNTRLNIPPARLLAMPPEYMALDARLEAWLNLSQREKARVFVIVKVSAIAVGSEGGVLANLSS